MLQGWLLNSNSTTIGFYSTSSKTWLLLYTVLHIILLLLAGTASIVTASGTDSHIPTIAPLAAGITSVFSTPIAPEAVSLKASSVAVSFCTTLALALSNCLRLAARAALVLGARMANPDSAGALTTCRTATFLGAPIANESSMVLLAPTGAKIVVATPASVQKPAVLANRRVAVAGLALATGTAYDPSTRGAAQKNFLVAGSGAVFSTCAGVATSGDNQAGGSKERLAILAGIKHELGHRGLHRLQHLRDEQLQVIRTQLPLVLWFLPGSGSLRGWNSRVHLGTNLG